MLKYDIIKTADEDHLMQTYKRLPALFVQGAGCSLWDNRGNEYLDLLAGVAVCQLGHCHPAVVSALTRQAQQLIHVSNHLLTAPQAQLAERLCELSGMERVFFANCGATAVETALKIAKKHGNQKAKTYRILSLQGSFHGRTLGAVSITGQEKFQTPFEPLIPNIEHLKPNDLDALEKAFGDDVAAIILEPILGEGGVIPLTTEYLQKARELATKHNALLILDEIQTGMGRTGKWFAFQHHGIQPDVMCLAKGLGGGIPIGVCLAKGEAATILQPGDHGSTFGGNPLACAVSLAVIDTLDHQNLLQNATKIGAFLKNAFNEIGEIVTEVRGEGLMLGVVLKNPVAKQVAEECFAQRLIVNAPSDSVLRIIPPLTLSEDQAQMAVEVIAGALGVKPPRAVHALTPTQSKYHDILSIDDLSNDQIEELLDLAAYLKERRKLAPSVIPAIEGQSVALVFEKPSLRTRVSFETAIRELGGQAIYLTKNDIGLGQRESVKDISENLARWCSIIVARLFWHKQLQEVAQYADVPVVNALTEWEHPCQALADMLTIREQFGKDPVKITYVGDGNNVSRSLAKVALRLGYDFTVCGPENFGLEEMDGLVQTPDLTKGLGGAQVVYTDVWISMGDEHEQDHRLKVFDKYQVNQEVMRIAAKDAIFLHCLPARRGYEVTDEVMDSSYSKVVDQAENRLHAQKALLQKIMFG